MREGLFKRIPEFVDNGCPFCLAPPNEFCVTASGLVRRDHDARIKARTQP